MQFTKEQLIEHAKKHIAHDVWLRNKFGETHWLPMPTPPKEVKP
ncbi:hypothetical protein M942_04605 [Enterobacter ludwigii]|jgi:hypothetical protein|nr:hypothetical protein M942_04605 [Enterobacter ludwigii]